MKKFISMLIVTVMMLSVISVNAFAAEVPVDGDTSHDVYAKYAEGAKTDSYKASISWGSMKFVYTTKSEVWNTTNHDWDIVTAARWSVDGENANEITVTNHSSKDITAALSFAPTAGNGVTGGKFTNNGSEKTSVVIGNALSGKAKTETITFMPEGTLTKTDANTADFVSIGSITVTLS